MSLERTTTRVRTAAAVAVGNALEFYDFGTFSFFAIQIGHAFFPESRTAHGLLASLATFGVGFLTRPLGGILIGRYGDRAGRKPAMLVSFGLMGLGVVGLAVTPSYAKIGMMAPVLLVMFRLLQGFALGGEVGPSTSYLVEVAPANRRGLYASVQAATQGMSILAAGLVAFALSMILTPAQLDAWGWRLALLLGAVIVPIGLYIRGTVTETLNDEGPTVRTKTARLRLIPLLMFIAMLGSMSITTYVVGYLATYAQDALKMSARQGFGTTIAQGMCFMCVSPVSGWLSDRYRRKPVMLSALCVLLLSVVPCFMAMNAWRTEAVLFLSSALFTSCQQLLFVPILVMITECVPRSVRAGTLSMVYALAIALFGGSAQFIIKGLSDWTASPLAPAWYLTGALCVGGVAMIAVPMRRADHFH